MEKILLLSWNVNGIRSTYRKGFMDWLSQIKPDVLCIQETKANSYQLSPDLAQPNGYFAYWNSAKRAGYSGTAIFSREKPLSIEFGLGIDKFDQEGRTIIAQYPDFTLINCYFPNGGRDNSRVEFKMAFYNAFFEKCEDIRSNGCNLIFCGDVNTAHKEIDLARPNSNKKKTGFLSIERAWMDKLISSGYLDTFRYFHPNAKDQYTWWSSLTKARERNVGWRLDYFFIIEESIQKVVSAFIMPEVLGSDHCPIGIELQIETRRSGHIKQFEKRYHQSNFLDL